MKKITIILAILFVFTFTACKKETDAPLQKLKGEVFICESTSPDNMFLIRAYRNNGGATVDWSVLCTLTDTKTKETKNIYWQYKEKDARIEWVDNDTVKINNVSLHLPDDTYDWRNE